MPQLWGVRAVAMATLAACLLPASPASAVQIPAVDIDPLQLPEPWRHEWPNDMGLPVGRGPEGVAPPAGLPVASGPNPVHHGGPALDLLGRFRCSGQRYRHHSDGGRSPGPWSSLSLGPFATTRSRPAAGSRFECPGVAPRSGLTLNAKRLSRVGCSPTEGTERSSAAAALDDLGLSGNDNRISRAGLVQLRRSF
jgi:hypothetical protein